MKNQTEVKNEKYNLCYNLIKIISCLLLFSLFLLLSYQYLNSKFIPHQTYCYNQNRNDSLMNNFVDNSDPLINIDCDSTKYRIGWYQYCNSSCMEKVNNCISKLPLDERKFMVNCSWGVSATITGGMFLLISFFGLFLFLFIQELRSLIREFKK